jgi:hypothetical protein
MVTTRVKPRGPFYACKHARTHPRVFVDIRVGIPAKMVVVIWLRFGDAASQLSGYLNLTIPLILIHSNPALTIALTLTLEGPSKMQNVPLADCNHHYPFSPRYLDHHMTVSN